MLKFIRAKPSLAKVPVAVLTNAFMSDHARAVSSMGVERAIIKGDCTPNKMLELAQQITGSTSSPTPGTASDTSQLNNEAREAFLKSIPTEFTDLRMISQELPKIRPLPGAMEIFTSFAGRHIT
ncbi:MAG: hypothetical protein QM813_06655 [Verrucomicrobiota bacterium]